MNLVLCYPPKREYQGYGQDKRWLPLGISALGAYVSRELPDVSITLLDLFDMDPDASVAAIKTCLKPAQINLVGITCFTEQRMSALGLCAAVKADNVYTALGGPHASIMAEQLATTCDFVDFIVRGEGEAALKQILVSLQQGKKPDRIIQGQNLKLTTLPPAIEGFKLFSSVPKLEEAPIVFSRGCTDHCSFYSTTEFWKGYRSRRADDVFIEMLSYYSEYGTTQFKFHDDSCTANLWEWKKLCKKIIDLMAKPWLVKKGIRWQFEITARADQFDDELISLLSKAGCHKVAVGIESGNEGLRKAMNKRLDIHRAKENIQKLIAAGIEVAMLLVVGYPGETDETIKETCQMVREFQPTYINKMPLMIFPGTQIYEQLKQDGWITDEYWTLDVPQPYYTREVKLSQLFEWVDKLTAACGPVRVLVCAPIREKDEIFKAYLESLRALNVPEWVIVDKLFLLHNSEHLKKYLTADEKYYVFNNTVEYSKDDRTHYWEQGNFSSVVAMKNLLLRYALEAGFDYIFLVDSDLILHPLTLQELLDADKDIIAEVFWTVWDKDNPDMKPLPNAWRYDSYSIDPGEVEQWKTPGAYLTGMAGACTLIKRKVLESGVNFSPINNVTFTLWEDRAFCIRAAVHGFEIWLDTHHPARHLYRDEDYQDYIKEGITNVTA